MAGAWVRTQARAPAAWVMAAIAALAWLVRYDTLFGLHPARDPMWSAWFDQGKYMLSARAFAQGDLAAAAHWYPLAYSLLASPFQRIVPHDPFFLLDLLLFGITAAGFARAMRPLGLAPWGALPLFLLADLGVPKVARLWLEPWTTTLSAALIWWLLAQAAAIAWPRDGATGAPTRARMLGVGLLAGALPAARPADALIGAIVLAGLAVALVRARRLAWEGVLSVLLGGLAVCLPYLALHLAIYGPRPSDYMHLSAQQGFAFADLPWKSYVLLITPQPWFPGSKSMIEAMPWILPGAAGLLAALCGAKGPARCALGLMLAAALPYTILFLAYTDLQPTGLWTFNNAHYFKWLFPLLAAGAWLWLRGFATRRGAVVSILALIVMIAPACLRSLPRAVPDGASARMLIFRGTPSPPRDWNAAYFARATVTDSEGVLANVRQFHQIPSAEGARAIAVARLFAGHPMRSDPGEAPPFRGPQAPSARFGAIVSPGIPCWFARKACRLPLLPPSAPAG